ncbi:MAG: AAA family ATPase [Clostridia bacterium]|nr:AAA family ATPase [Clostridia bacterium]
MKKRQYFLRLENATKIWFKIIKDEVGVKVFVPLQMPERFHKITTETESFCGTKPESDGKILKTKYKNCDVFYLNISDIFNNDVEFDLSTEPDIVAAFVCIPKNEQGYKEKPEEYIDFVGNVLENYYNDANNWYIFVADKDCEKFKNDESRKYYDYVVEDYTLFMCDDKFSQKDKKFFEKCKIKYGIPQSEIGLAKKIIQSNKQLKKAKYSITPELVKKLREQPINIKTPMALPITLGKNDFKQDLYAIKHLLITGRTGTGKTTLLKSILTSINHQPKNANCKIVLIDTKNFDFNGYSSEYLMTPVITNTEKAVEYLNQIQSNNEDIAIIIDELADLIAVQSNIQDVLIKLAENPKIHIIVATRKIDLLSVDFMEIFDNRVAFNNNKIGECLYFSNETCDQICFKTIFNKKGGK